MRSLKFLLVCTLTSLTHAARLPECRCLPRDPCWPTATQWNALNHSISGQLIRDEPLAKPCYPGPQYNAAECAHISAQFTNMNFQEKSPVGYYEPISITCPPVNASARHQAGRCTLGAAPVYTVNATDAKQIAAGLAFARKHNLRLVIRDTGHDLLGRSEGVGSLQIWIRYLRTGIVYQKQYKASDACTKSGWTGQAFKIGGGYTWTDVYPEAFKRNLVIVGGGTPTVGCLGGWMQGGGHSPATHNFGLGADQVLEAEVVLPDGTLVTASPCSHPDLFFAIRGGGGGTYGIVTSTTVKAYHSKNVVVQTLAMAPLFPNDTSQFMEALADLYQALPSLKDAGYSGYGTWSIASLKPVFANFTAGYTHAFATMGQTLSASKSAAAPLIAKLRRYNGTSLIVSVTYTPLPNYSSYYTTFSGKSIPAGALGAETSRLLPHHSLRSRRALLSTLRTLAGHPNEHTTNSLVFTTGGAVAHPGPLGLTSAVLPAWRTAVVHNIVSRPISTTAGAKEAAAIHDDITYVKGAALRRLAPDSGTYMNEANRFDPEYALDFYGEHLFALEAVKLAVDPEGLLYCPTCVGSWDWVEKDAGRLCRREIFAA